MLTQTCGRAMKQHGPGLDPGQNSMDANKNLKLGVCTSMGHKKSACSTFSLLSLGQHADQCKGNRLTAPLFFKGVWEGLYIYGCIHMYTSLVT